MFDPRIGRWLSEDPIGFQAGDTDLYRYVGNSLANLTDPSGLVGDRNRELTERQRRDAFYEARDSDTVPNTHTATDGQRYRFRVDYNYFTLGPLGERQVLFTRIGNVRDAVRRVLADLGPENTSDRPWGFQRYNALSPAVRARLSRFFGDGNALDNWHLSDVRRVFWQVANAIDEYTLYFENDYAPDGDNLAWVLNYGIYWGYIHLCPSFWTVSPRRQAAAVFHELSHVYGRTEDFGYARLGSWTPGEAANRPSYRLRGRDVTLTTRELRRNASTYEWFFYNYYLTWLPETPSPRPR
jgi:hypothetical protein